MATPAFNDIVAFVREFTGTGGSRAIQDGTRLEADLGVTGDDGVDLLNAAMDRFQVDLASPDRGIAKTLGLRPNEYFFSPEGFDLLGILWIIRRLKGEPRPMYRDLTVGELHSAIIEAPPLESDNAA